MAINFNDYLKMTGLGESAPITRRRKRNVKPGKFNPVAFAESYSYIIQEGRRMRLSGIANERQARQITARGEAGIEDAKDFIKDKYKQAKDFLIKLWEKVVRFFTETLRYWMSNERKIGKTIAKLKAALKTKKDKMSVPLYKYAPGSAGESYKGKANRRFRPYGEKDDDNTGGSSNAEEEDIKKRLNAIKTLSTEFNAESIKKNIVGTKDGIDNMEKVKNMTKEKLEADPNFNFAFYKAVLEYTATIDAFETAVKALEKLTDEKSVDEANDAASAIMTEYQDTVRITTKNIKDTENKEIQVSQYKGLVGSLIEVLENLKGMRFMKTLQGKIRDGKKALERLKKEYKEVKDPSENQTLGYQLERIELQNIIKVLNVCMSGTDKIVGKVIKYAGKVINCA